MYTRQSTVFGVAAVTFVTVTALGATAIVILGEPTVTWASLLAAPIIAVVTSLMVALLLDRRIFRPIDRLVGSLESAMPEVNRELGIPPGTEHGLEALSRKLDSLMGRLSATENQVKLERAASRGTKREFLAHTNQEWRGTLNTLVGLLQLIRETELNGDQRALLQSAISHVSLLTERVSGVLDLAQMETGEFELYENTNDLHELIYGCLQEQRVAAIDKGLILAVRLDPAIPHRVRIDEQRFREVVSSLIHNAITATAHGAISVLAYLQKRDEHEAVVYFEVTDSRSTKLAADEQFGANTDLDIARELAVAMGSELVAEQRQCGASFGLAIPLGVPTEAEEDWQFLDGEVQSLRALVADNEGRGRSVVRNLLERMGFEVVDCQLGLELLRVFESEPFDLVVLDTQLPDLDGPTAATQLRALDVPWSRASIIGLDAGSPITPRRECIAAGMDEVLHKPIEFGHLRSAIERSVWMPVDSSVDTGWVEEVDNTTPVPAFDAVVGLSNTRSLEGWEELVESFIITTSRHLERISDDIYSDDIAAIPRDARAIKLAASMVGAEHIVALAADLEIAAEESEEGLRDRLEDLRASFTTAEMEWRISNPSPEMTRHH